MTSPRAWKRFVTTPDVVTHPKFAKFSRFNARYRVATSFEGASFAGMAKATQDGYSAALRVALAYSVLEALGAATRSKGKLGATVVSADLRSRYALASNDALRKLLESDTDSPVLREDLRSIVAGATDVTPVAAAIRHLTLHGPLTASGAGLAKSATSRRFLADLAVAVIAAADDAFESYLDVHAIGPWDVDRLEACPRCGVKVGTRHAKGCSIAVCRMHGEQWMQCLRPGKHASTTFRGVYPGTVEALKRGWVVETPRGPMPDLNRVLLELRWDAEAELFL